MPLSIVRQDITQMNVDAIVNAANTDLQAGGGVCGAIFRAAGVKELQEACNMLAPIKTGGAAITPGFNLQSKYVIHAAGPIYSHWSKSQSREYLYSAYKESLMLAEQNKCKSIAFPLISSGIYGYPKGEALQVATEAIRDYLNTHDMDVYLCVFDADSFVISEALLGEVESYIDENYVDSHRYRRSELMQRDEAILMGDTVPDGAPPIAAMTTAEGVNGLFDDLDEPFSTTLLKLIDSKGKEDVDVYKKANIDKRLFSKIRTGKGYTPRKSTILALAIALELSLEETDDLLERAGYALSHANKFDVVIEYFIVKKKYDIDEINQVLFKFDLPILGSI